MLAILAYSCMKAFALLFGVTLHRPSYSMAPLYSPCFSPFSPLIRYLPSSVDVLLFLDLTQLLPPYLPLRFSGLFLEFPTLFHQFSSPPVMSRLARFLSLLSCLISAVTHGGTSSLMTLTGQTSAATSLIRLVSPSIFFFMSFSLLTGPIRCSTCLLYLSQSPFLRFNSTLLILFILVSFFDSLSIGTWSEDRSWMMFQRTPSHLETYRYQNLNRYRYWILKQNRYRTDIWIFQF